MKQLSLFLVGLFTLLCTFNSWAQRKPYELKWKQEIILLGVGFGGVATSLGLGLNMDELSPDAISRADRDQIWALDRRATRYWSPDASLASDWGRNIGWSLPFLSLLDKSVRQDFWTTAILTTEAVAITSALTGLTKVIARRERPFVYNDDAPFEEKNSRSARLSFFSGHTSVTAALCFVTAQIYTDHHPGQTVNPFLWATAATIPAATGYFRYRAGKHFPTDVVVGYLVGAGIGMGIPRLHRRSADEQGWYWQLGSDRLALGWRW